MYEKDIDEKLLKRLLCRPTVIFAFDSCESTNNLAKNYAAQGGALPAVFISREQTGGRGRFSRSFTSARDKGLYFTFAFTVAANDSCLQHVTPAAAVSVCEALCCLSELTPSVKWVNDVYLDGKKTCGILTEARRGPLKTHVFVGIGVNICCGAHLCGLPNATALDAHTLKLPSREALAAEIFNRFCDSLRTDTLMDRYRKLNFLLGRRI